MHLFYNICVTKQLYPCAKTCIMIKQYTMDWRLSMQWWQKCIQHITFVWKPKKSLVENIKFLNLFLINIEAARISLQWKSLSFILPVLLSACFELLHMYKSFTLSKFPSIFRICWFSLYQSQSTSWRISVNEVKEEKISKSL